MRTMDQGQLQKLLTAAAAVSTTPQQNPMMLFSSMTSQATTPPIWPIKSHSLVNTPPTQNSIEANLAAYILLQQAFQNQQALSAISASSIPTLPSPSISTPSFLPSSFSLPLFSSSTIPTSLPTPTLTPTIQTSGTQCSTPPGVFSTLNSLLQIPTQLDSNRMSKCTTPPIIIKPSTTPLDTLRKISTVSIPSEFVPVIPTPSASASGSGSLPASSPSTSSKKEEEDEEDEEEEFVDIESVDVAIDGKEKRKAHVEFYRRMKYMRQQDKALQCGMCKKKVENHENAMAVHVAEHAEAGCYQCRLCGWQAIDKYKIYTHMREEHPRKVDMFVDKRDMPKMCLVLSQCFPKTSSRPKKESNRNADTYLTEVLKGPTLEQTCKVCNNSVRRDKAAMIRHVQTNHTIKCKTCKTISTTLEDQLTHQDESHQLKDPKMSVHYAPSAAAIYLLPALEKCFPNEKQ